MARYPWAASVADSNGAIQVHSVAQLPYSFGGRYAGGVAVIGTLDERTSVFLHKNPMGLVIKNTRRQSFHRLYNTSPQLGGGLGLLLAQRYGHACYALYDQSALRFTSSTRTWHDADMVSGLAFGGVSGFVSDHANPMLWVQNSASVVAVRDSAAGWTSPWSESYSRAEDVLAVRVAPPLNRNGAPRLWWFVRRPRGPGIDIRVYYSKWLSDSHRFEHSDGALAPVRSDSRLVGVIRGLVPVGDASCIYLDRRTLGAPQVSIYGLRPRGASTAAGCTYTLTVNGGFRLMGLYRADPNPMS